MKKTPREVCILAGGLSARMGRDKSSMRLEGKTLLEHVKGVASALEWPARVIRRDLVPRCGPLGGVYSAMKTSDAGIFLFLACDMPFVPLSFLAELAGHLDSKTDAVFAQLRGRAGFPFLLRRAVLYQIETQIASRRFSLQQLARRCAARRVSSPAGQSWRLLNINSPQDWQLAQKMARKGLNVEPL